MSKLSKPLKFLLYFLLVLIAVLIAVYNSLSFVIENSLPGIVERLGFGRFSLSVRRVSFSGIDLDSLALGEGADSVISVSSIDADYSIWGIIAEKKISSLVLTGAEINCAYDGKKISFSSLDLSKFQNTQPKGDASSNAFVISSVEIRDSLLKVDYQGKHFVIPFELKYRPDQNYKAGQGELSLFFREQPVKVAFSFDPKTAQFTLNIKDFNLKSLYGLLPEGSEISGLLTSDIKAEIALSPFSIKSLDAQAILKDGKFNSKGSEVSSPVIELKAKGSGKSFEIEASPISIEQNGKELANLSSFKFDVSLAEKVISGCTALIVGMPFAGAVNSIPLNINFAYNFAEGSVKGDLKSEEFSLNMPKGRALLKSVSLSADLRKSDQSYKGQLSLGIEDIQMPGFDLSVNSFKATAPLEPAQTSDTPRKGIVAIGNITYKNFNLGSLSGEVNNNGSSVAFSATAPNVVLPDMAVKMNGQFGKGVNGLFFGELFFNLPKYNLAIPFDLGAWFPKAKGITFQGELEADGFMKIAHSGIKSGMNLKISDSTIDMKIKDASAVASGVSLNLKLDDILKLESQPSQCLKVKKVSFGTFSLENIYALFHIESFKTILFEGIGAQWCGGIVSVQAIRINPTEKNYALAISCDRVNLAQLLRQFNVGQAEGEGTLNGSLPLIIKEDSIKFGNGFLYSTPGDSGKIHIQGGAIDSITDGVPDGTPQFDQLKLSQMALKDFDYDWVKLYLNSEGDDMILKLQFDGKPAKPLPFVYKKEIGGFVKVDVNSAGSVFQGIRLDVNIKLPFNKLLWYNKQMQSYLKQL